MGLVIGNQFGGGFPKVLAHKPGSGDIAKVDSTSGFKKHQIQHYKAYFFLI